MTAVRRRWFVLVSGALGALWSVCMSRPAANASQPPKVAAPTVKRQVDWQGHRGARGLRPENTLAGFAHALGLGVTTLELDLGVTRDGVVVISHDPELNPDHTRDANGRWLETTRPALFSLTLAELRRYDVGRLRPGTAYALRFASQAAVDGERVPTFAELAALVRRSGNTQVRFNVETKIDPRFPQRTLAPEAFADAVIDVLRAEGLAARSTIQSFDWRTLRRVQTRAPEIARVCLTSQSVDDTVQAGRAGPSPWLGGLDADDFGGSVPRLVQAAGAAVWSPFYGDVTAATVAQAHELGLRVVVWTANEPELIDALLDMGVDGIISDYPDRLRQAAQRHGLAYPEPTPVDLQPAAGKAAP